MMPLLVFLLWLVILCCEGRLLAVRLVQEQKTACAWALPLAAIGNVLVIFLFTILHIPLSFLTMLLAHIVIIAVLWMAHRKQPVGALSSPGYIETWTPKKKFLAAVCGVLLANAVIFSAVHAVVLPSLSIDVFTNWTMRSQVSWADGSMAFDRTEARGMAKPQYPFLVHGVQILVNEGNAAWNDRAANTITWLLTMSSFAAAFLMLRRMRGTMTALCALSTIVLLPMMTIHLSAGYGDIHVITYALLAFVSLAAFLETREHKTLLLSAVMVLGALWSKSEGLYFVFVPWAIAVLMMTWKQYITHRSSFITLAIPLLFFLPFLLLLIFSGLPLTPHESDGSFGIKWEGFAALPHALFGSGSLGVIWYVLPVAILAILLRYFSAPLGRPAGRYTRAECLALLTMGLLSLLGILFVYLFTPNVGFLLNGQSFYRQMLLPAALLIAWCALAIPWKGSSVTQN